ncbi:MAG: 2OG-Fe(II) oxygenase [Pseudomonadota bacterium]
MTAIPSNNAAVELAQTRELVSQEAFGSEGFERGVQILSRRAEAGDVDAQLLLGHLCCQFPGLPDAPHRALTLYRAAAERGHPEALMRLTDLAMFGYGHPRDDDAAFRYLSRLAEAGYATALCQLALLHSSGIGCAVDEAAAVTLILRAAAQGETLAFALLAERYLDGRGVARRPDLAWAWLDLACRRHFPASDRRRRQLSLVLTDTDKSAGDDAAQKLMDNIRSLGPAANAIALPESDPGYAQRFAQVVAENFMQLSDGDLSLDPAVRGEGVGPPARASVSAEPVSWEPRVFRVRRFADSQERLFLLAAAAGSLVSTGESTGADGGGEVDPFDGDCAVFAPHLVTPIVRIIQRRWAALLHIHEQHFEPMSVLRYGKGHEYSPHVDYFDSRRMAAHRSVGDLGGQRLITGLVYLVTPDGGGETEYCVAGPRVDGADGDAVFHFNSGVDGLPDALSLHQGRPITEGEKWLSRTAVRENNLYLNQETVL